jgi:hypothetical protein
MSKVQIFVSFDVEHDADLCDLLVSQSANEISGFEVSGRSEVRRGGDPAGESMRRRIREADEVIVICGEHTGTSTAVSDELRVAREEQTPYFLLWGRRGIMCTKPDGAKPAEGMYSWTRTILQTQISVTLRNARDAAEAPPRADATRGI